jgi:hypothetical protein
MMFTPQNQLESMISSAVGQVMCGNKVAKNTAHIIALQAQTALRKGQRNGASSPPNMFVDWIDWS